jgi:hypothetical protein
MAFKVSIKSFLAVSSVLAMCVGYIGCTEPEEEVTYADTEYSYMSIVGSDFTGSADVFNTWYNETHIPLLMQYPGLQKAVRFQNANAAAKPGFFAMYHYNTQADLAGMNSSAAFDTANKELAAHWQNNEYSMSYGIRYEKIKSWVKADYTGDLKAVTIVGVEITAGTEDVVNNWYNNTHIPLIMKYPGVKKAVRYKKLDGGANTDSLPTYIAVYYYPTADDKANQGASAEWKAVLDNMATETADDNMTPPKAVGMIEVFLKSR